MSTATSTLPPDWSKILDEMHMRLDHAITQAEARITQAPHVDAAVNPERCLEVAKWSERLQRLSDYLESAEQAVHSVDEVLQKEELRLRHQVTSSKALRQKLAERTGGAIG